MPVYNKHKFVTDKSLSNLCSISYNAGYKFKKNIYKVKITGTINSVVAYNVS